MLKEDIRVFDENVDEWHLTDLNVGVYLGPPDDVFRENIRRQAQSNVEASVGGEAPSLCRDKIFGGEFVRLAVDTGFIETWYTADRQSKPFKEALLNLLHGHCAVASSRAA